MNKIRGSYLTAMMLLSLLTKLYSQGCPPVSCPENQKYPYTYCDGNGHQVTLCTIDPNNPKGSMTNGDIDAVVGKIGSNYNLKPFKINLPICLEFDNSGPVTSEGMFCGDNGTNCRIGEMYKKNDFINDMTRAQTDWNCICNKQNSPCGCTVKIGFSIYSKDFTSFRVESGSNNLEVSKNIFTTNYDKTLTNSNCEVDCSKIKINLNNTLEYTNGVVIRSFESSSHTDNNWSTPTDNRSGASPSNSINLVHEIRYMIAKLVNANGGNENLFGNNGQFLSSSNTNCICPNSSKDITQLDHQQNTKPGISDCEKCMFQKLYCPPTSGIAQLDATNFSIAPNPTNDKMKINFSSNKLNSDFTIKITSSNGKIIKVISGKTKSVYDCISLNTSDIQSGDYFVELVLDKKILTQKLIINH
jgi:hypothetical protein